MGDGFIVYTMLFPALTAALYLKRANKWGIYAGIFVALFLRPCLQG